jgi:hypothetical protein
MRLHSPATPATVPPRGPGIVTPGTPRMPLPARQQARAAGQLSALPGHLLTSKPTLASNHSTSTDHSSTVAVATTLHVPPNTPAPKLSDQCDNSTAGCRSTGGGSLPSHWQRPAAHLQMRRARCQWLHAPGHSECWLSCKPCHQAAKGCHRIICGGRQPGSSEPGALPTKFYMRTAGMHVRVCQTRAAAGAAASVC